MKLSVNSGRAFATKEITESIRTKRLFVLAIVFIFLAIMGVIMARFAGEILEALISADGATGMTITMPPPVWSDSYAQLYSGLTEIGMISLIMLYMGAILREKRTGTIDLMMAKGLTPAAFVGAKFAVAVLTALAVLFVSVMVTYVYTLLLFEYAGQIGNVLFGALPFGVYMLMILATTMMWSAIAKSTAVSAVLGLVTLFSFTLLNFIPRFGGFMPARLLGHGVALSTGVGTNYLGIQIAVAMVFACLAFAVTVMVLKRREG